MTIPGVAFGTLTDPPTFDIETSDGTYVGEYLVEWWVLPVDYPGMGSPVKHSFSLDLTYTLCETATCVVTAVPVTLLYSEMTTFTGHECTITSAAGNDVNTECGPPSYSLTFVDPADESLVTTT